MTDSIARTVAVFDIGKTSSKVVLLDNATLKEIAVRRQENNVCPAPPYLHIDTERQWAFLCHSLSEFETEYGVDAIAITTHGATAAIVNADGLALPVLDYEFEIPSESVAKYTPLRPPFERSFSPLLPNGLNLGAQLYYLQSIRPDCFSSDHQILAFPQYWCWRLTGVAKSECTSLGTHTDLWDPKAGQFSSLVGDVFSPSLFPKMAKASDQFPLSQDAALATGLRPEIPVTCGIHDSNASLVPWLQSNEPITVISSGTWTVLMSLNGSLDGLDAKRDMLANVDANANPVPTARFMGGREYEILTAGISASCDLEDVQNIIGSDVFALPGWVPDVGPFPNGPGKWHPETPTAETARLAGATLYLAMMTTVCLDLIGAGKRIIVEGPFAKNEIYARLVATLSQAPVHLSPDATGTALGAAMLIAPAQIPDIGPPVTAFDIPELTRYFEKWRRLSRPQS